MAYTMPITIQHGYLSRAILFLRELFAIVTDFIDYYRAAYLVSGRFLLA